MAISAAELNIILSAKDKEFKKAMAANERRVQKFSKNSQKSLSKTSKAFGKLGGAAKGFLPALGVAAVVVGVKKVTSAMDEIGKKADAIGLGTDALQELRAAAVSAGMSQGGLDKSLEQFSKRLGEAVQGTGTAKIALEEMGLSAEDLAAMPLDKALGVFADKFALVEDATARTALATQVFGREGIGMVNVLKDGSVALDKSRKKMREMGVVIDEDLIRNAEEMQDRFDAASTVIGAQFSNVLGRLAPLLVRAAENAASLAIAVADVIDAIDDFVSGADSVDVAIRENVKAMGGEIRQSQALEEQLARGGKMSVAITRIKLQEAKSRQENARAAIQENRVMRLQSTAYADAQSNIDRLSKSSNTFDINKTAKRLGAVKAGLALEALNSQLARAYERRDQLISEAVPEKLAAQLDRATANVTRLQEALEKAKGGVIDLGPKVTPITLSSKAVARDDEKLNVILPEDQKKLTANFQAIKNEADDLTESLDVVGDAFADAFGDMISGTMSVEDAFKKMAGTIISELIKIQFQQMQTSGSSGSMIGGLLQAGGDLVGGLLGNAQGGTVQAGRPSVVGEHGRELFVPSVAGRILSVPQSKSALGGGGGVTVQQTINVSTGVQQTVRAEIQSMMPQIASASTKAVLNARRRGGSFAGAFS
jgi:hypothetical protein